MVRLMQDLTAFKRLGDKDKLSKLAGDVPFKTFADAFRKPPTVRIDELFHRWLSSSRADACRSWIFHIPRIRQQLRSALFCC
jgi:hypothetical protein